MKEVSVYNSVKFVVERKNVNGDKINEWIYCNIIGQTIQASGMQLIQKL